jgi:HPt (histidine-containing phosphotransfer) domain-containing protein
MRASQSLSLAAQAADTDAPRLIDLEHLRRYTLGDPGLELEILGLFAGQLPITIGALEHATTDKDWGMAAHTLKGSARAVGAWPLAALAEDAERLTTNPDAGRRAAILRRLEAAADEARAYIAALARET